MRAVHLAATALFAVASSTQPQTQETYDRFEDSATLMAKGQVMGALNLIVSASYAGMTQGSGVVNHGHPRQQHRRLLPADDPPARWPDSLIFYSSLHSPVTRPRSMYPPLIKLFKPWRECIRLRRVSPIKKP